MGKRGGTGGEVGVDVGLEDMRDGEGVGAGVFEIGLDVADGVDDDSLSAAREDVGVLGESGDFEALDLHLAFFLLEGLMIVVAVVALDGSSCKPQAGIVGVRWRKEHAGALSRVWYSRCL